MGFYSTSVRNKIKDQAEYWKVISNETAESKMTMNQRISLINPSWQYLNMNTINLHIFVYKYKIIKSTTSWFMLRSRLSTFIHLW